MLLDPYHRFQTGESFNKASRRIITVSTIIFYQISMKIPHLNIKFTEPSFPHPRAASESHTQQHE